VSNTWTVKALVNLAKIEATKHLVQNARYYFPIDPNTSQLLRQSQELCHTTAYHFMQQRREQLVRTGFTLAPEDREIQKLMRISNNSLHDHNETDHDHSLRVRDYIIYDHDADKHEELLNIRSVSNSTLESKLMRVSDEILGSRVVSVFDVIQISCVKRVSGQNLELSVLSLSDLNWVSSV
jgi:hypothetical protein